MLWLDSGNGCPKRRAAFPRSEILKGDYVLVQGQERKEAVNPSFRVIRTLCAPYRGAI